MFDVRLTLTTRNGRQGVQMLRADPEMKWDVQDGDDETVSALFAYVMEDGEVIEEHEIDGDEWRALEEWDDLPQLLTFIAGGCSFSGSIDAMVMGCDPDGWNQDQDDGYIPGKPKTNEDLVRDLMNYNPAGALCQAFIIEAITRYAKACAAADPKTFDSAFMNGAAWVKCAKHIKDTCEAFYARHDAPAKG